MSDGLEAMTRVCLTAATQPQPPTCGGVPGETWRRRHRRPRTMVLIGSEDDGTLTWRCPRCLFIWREREG